jgi:hypothetical protein
MAISKKAMLQSAMAEEMKEALATKVKDKEA